MTEDNRQQESSQGPPTLVPTAFGAEITLPPGGTKEVTFQVDQDTLLYGVSVQADGPAILRYRIAQAPPEGASGVQVQEQTFEEYLEREFPVHLAALVGEDLRTWAATNQALLERAGAGDDEAFFELLARDPRQLSSELTLRRVLTWRTQIDFYNRYYRVKASRFLATKGAVDEAREQMERARRNLGRLGESQLRLYDQRGKRPLPPPALVRGIYYGLLCLLRGLRAFYEGRRKAGGRAHQLERDLSAFIDGLADLRREFLFYVATAVQMVRDSEVLKQAGLSDISLSTLAAGQGMAPSETARLLTAAAFEVSEDTVERLAAQPVAIPLPSSGAEGCLLAGPPTFDLLQFEEVKALVATLTR